MYAQRFGSLPIGRRTGGLSETISDGETGYLFSEPSTESLLGAICCAFATFGHKARLNAMRTAAMAKSYSWTQSAPAYVSLYRRARAA
jgi:starch synthase